MSAARLRPWTTDDAEALRVAASSDPDLRVQLGGVVPATVAEARRYVEAHLLPRPGGHHFAVEVDGIAVGDVGVSAVDERHGTAWTSYWLAADHRGRGLATRGLAAVAAWALGERGLFRLELGHRVNNPASCRVATRAGFVAEGVERAKLRYGAERFDVEAHARLATDPVPAVDPLPLDVIPGVGTA